MSLKLYLDLMSQPSRSLFILLKTVKYNFEPKFVDLRNGEHYSDQFTQQVNRLQRVPVIDHNGFILTESVAILKYLSREQIIPDTLYPVQTKKQARVEEFLEWHHTGLRLHCAMYFRVKYMNPILTGKANDPKLIAGYEHRMIDALDNFNSKWLGQGNSFITGEECTVADLMAACEIEQPRMAGFEAVDKFDNIAVWKKKVEEFFNPHYDEAHVIVNKIVNKGKKKMAKL